MPLFLLLTGCVHAGLLAKPLPPPLPAGPTPGGTLGIGRLFVESDGTSASFDAASWFSDVRRVTTSQGPMGVKLIDYPTEAEYSLSGVIEGKFDLETKVSGGTVYQPKDGVLKTVAVIVGGSLPVIAAIPIAIFSGSPPCLPLSLCGVGVPIIVYGIVTSPNAADGNHLVIGELVAKVKVRHNGTTVADLVVKAPARRLAFDFKNPDVAVALRQRVFEPIWIELGNQIRAGIDQERAQARTLPVSAP